MQMAHLLNRIPNVASRALATSAAVAKKASVASPKIIVGMDVNPIAMPRLNADNTH